MFSARLAASFPPFLAAQYTGGATGKFELYAMVGGG
jgi:hypothetical protein